jgi:hypothetical protein
VLIFSSVRGIEGKAQGQTLVYPSRGEGQYPPLIEGGRAIMAKNEMQVPMETIDRLTADDFARYLGRKVWPDRSSLEMLLYRIDRPKFSGWEGMARSPFSLIFRGPCRPVLPEGLYPIAIAEGPILTLYIIPILTAPGDHQEYQAVFN